MGTIFVFFCDYARNVKFEDDKGTIRSRDSKKTSKRMAKGKILQQLHRILYKKNKTGAMQTPKIACPVE